MLHDRVACLFRCCHAKHGSADGLSGEVDVHVEAVLRQLGFMRFHICPASAETQLLRAEPDAFQCPFRAVFGEVVCQLHDDRCARHVVVCTRSLRNGIVMSRQRQDFLWLLGSRDAQDDIFRRSPDFFLL